MYSEFISFENWNPNLYLLPLLLSLNQLFETHLFTELSIILRVCLIYLLCLVKVLSSFLMTFSFVSSHFLNFFQKVIFVLNFFHVLNQKLLNFEKEFYASSQVLDWNVPKQSSRFAELVELERIETSCQEFGIWILKLDHHFGLKAKAKKFEASFQINKITARYPRVVVEIKRF